MVRSTNLPIGILALGVVVGLVQTIGFFAAVNSAYPSELVPSTPTELLVTFGGLVVLCVVGVFVSLNYQLVLPVLLVFLTPIHAFFREWAADPIEIQHLGGELVVNRGDFLLGYTRSWLVWLFVVLLAGVGEYAVRQYIGVFPLSRQVSEFSLPVKRRRALVFAGVVGTLCAFVFLEFSLGGGIFAGRSSLPLLPWAAVGMVALAGERDVDELVAYVEEERLDRQRERDRRNAPAWRRAKWWLFGRSD